MLRYRFTTMDCASWSVRRRINLAAHSLDWTVEPAGLTSMLQVLLQRRVESAGWASGAAREASSARDIRGGGGVHGISGVFPRARQGWRYRPSPPPLIHPVSAAPPSRRNRSGSSRCASGSSSGLGCAAAERHSCNIVKRDTRGPPAGILLHTLPHSPKHTLTCTPPVRTHLSER
jgi:hypothetical protein